MDEFLIQALPAFERREKEFQSAVLAALKELEELERKELEDAQVEFDVETLETLRQLAEEKVLGDLTTSADANIMEQWEERERVWSEMMYVFGSLGGMLGRGWDLSRGIIKQMGWTKIAELRKIIASLLKRVGLSVAATLHACCRPRQQI